MCGVVGSTRAGSGKRSTSRGTPEGMEASPVTMMEEMIRGMASPFYASRWARQNHRKMNKITR